jgi:integrase
MVTVERAQVDHVRSTAGRAAHPQEPITGSDRGAVHILPSLGDLFVSELTAKRLGEWLGAMARRPAQLRSIAGKPQYRTAPASDDEVRARRVTANRVLTMLKAALNHAFDNSAEGAIKNRDAWGRKLKRFKGVDTARERYLSVAESQRLLNSCDPDFRSLIRGALETGCRYGELTRLMVHDFNPDAGTLAITRSKSGKSRHVVLTPEGAGFFRQHCTGRAGDELMFRHDGGTAWQRSQQSDRMRDACKRAKIKPYISFHGLRHTWASLAVMAGLPLMIVARNLGHVDTRMVEPGRHRHRQCAAAE